MAIRRSGGSPERCPNPGAPRKCRQSGGFVVPVIPLGEIRFDSRMTAEAEEFAGGVGAKPSARQHVRERYPADPKPKRARLRLAMNRQQKVGDADVPAGQRPKRLPVSKIEQPQPDTSGGRRFVRPHRTFTSMSGLKPEPKGELAKPEPKAEAVETTPRS